VKEKDNKNSKINSFGYFSFNSIYTGTTYSHKINKLQENTPYNFRICAKNDSGAGLWSEIYTFTTTKAPPNALKGFGIFDFYFL